MPLPNNIRMSLYRIRSDIRNGNLLSRYGIEALKLLYQDRPVPPVYLLFLHSLTKRHKGLTPDKRQLISTGQGLRNSKLSWLLRDAELGDWSLDIATINFIERQIQKIRPRLIIEFGSGVSTACLTQFMRELHGESARTYVLSIDQDDKYRHRTETLLDGLDALSNAHIIHAPLRHQSIEGLSTTCYDLSEESIRSRIGDATADLCLIDGPYAEPGARFGTLPLVKNYLSHGAQFFLDDSLRPGELRVARQWQRLPYIKLSGIRLVGKGLLTGRVITGS